MKMRLSGTVTDPENASLFYAVIGLLPVAIYLDKFIPDMSSTDWNKLLDWMKVEIMSVLLLPLLMLMGLKLLAMTPFDLYHPSAVGTYIVLLLSLWFSPKVPKAESGNYGLHRVIQTGYIVWTIAFTYFTCSMTGVDTFKFLKHDDNLQYLFPPQRKSLPLLRRLSVNYNGENIVFAMNRGLFTKILNEDAPEWLFHFVLFYMSHLCLTSVFRCCMYFTYITIDSIVRSASSSILQGISAELDLIKY